MNRGGAVQCVWGRLKHGGDGINADSREDGSGQKKKKGGKFFLFFSLAEAVSGRVRIQCRFEYDNDIY